MASLLQDLSQVVGDAFSAEGLAPVYGEVRRSDRPDLGEFQCNGALAAAKAVKKDPRSVAERVAARLDATSSFSSVSLAGPGFINLTLRPEVYAQHIARVERDARLGIAKPVKSLTVMVDFGGPNIAKLMHVGHLRSTIIGDSLQRLFRFVGHDVISDIHVGDWGKPMGMLISEVARR